MLTKAQDLDFLPPFHGMENNAFLAEFQYLVQIEIACCNLSVYSYQPMKVYVVPLRTACMSLDC